MDNRELLELAAKAAGHKVLGYVEGYDDFYWYGPSWGLQVEGVNGVWNPLEDDGDALRLAVKLKLEIDLDGMAHWGPVVTITAAHWRKQKLSGLFETCNGDPYAATRRAIVSAAAEIGKTMKK